MHGTGRFAGQGRRITDAGRSELCDAGVRGVSPPALVYPGFDVADDVADGVEALQVAVGDGDAEVLFDPRNDLDKDEGVDAGGGFEGFVRIDLLHGEVDVVLEDVQEFFLYIHNS